ncbi:hypothetical protein BD626DRAFT_472353 [Schizophyllum amplum]|uniref:EthD domain-containing protein n=1 Tax=Schizophyllum amplum TaxID=97359 RepID=A0A550CVU6_9AGAR|nr:hypothetical protein BD626DRAFT_472353 [Auriculariopsis ampla]
MERPDAEDVPYLAVMFIRTNEPIDWSSAQPISGSEGDSSAAELPAILYSDTANPSDGPQRFVVVMWTTVHPEELTQGVSLVMAVAGDVASVETRVYDPLNAGASPNALKGAKHLVFRAMTPKEGGDEELNKWYEEEHIPMLSKVPTWESAARFRLYCASTEKVPKYLALYEWGDVNAASASPEYKAAVATPASEKILSAVTQDERLVLEFLRYL